MKRYGNLYSQIYDMDNLKLAHHNAKKGKGWLVHCNNYRLTQKYIKPIEQYSIDYYKNNIKQHHNKK